MARSNRLFIFGGILCAAIAFVGIFVFLGSQGSATSGGEPATQNVLVALEDIDVGEEVTPAKVETREVAADAVAGTPLGDPSLVGNRAAVFSVAQGQQVNEETFGRVPTGLQFQIADQLRPGEKAVAFQVDHVTGLDFLVQPGDVVDIIVTVDVSVSRVDPESGDTTQVEGDDFRTVKTVLQMRRVLYVSDVGQFTPETEEGEEEEAEPAVPVDSMIIIIAGTDQDAEVLRFAQRDESENGRLSVTLRSPGDEALEDTTGITLDRLITDYGLPVPNVVILPESTPAP